MTEVYRSLFATVSCTVDVMTLQVYTLQHSSQTSIKIIKKCQQIRTDDEHKKPTVKISNQVKNYEECTFAVSPVVL